MCLVWWTLFLNDKTKSLFAPGKLGSNKLLINKIVNKHSFDLSVGVFEGYLFQLVVRLNPDFSCCSNFLLS